MLKPALDEFMHYLQVEKGVSENTLQSYKRDLNHYLQYMEKVIRKSGWDDIGRTDITGFLYKLKDDGKSSSTIARAISSIRSFHRFLVREQLTNHDASIHIETPRKERKLPAVLSSKDVDALLAIGGSTPLELRNKAMLELLYATGLRVTELVSLKVSDLHLTMGFVRCLGKGSKERIVPLGDIAKKAVEAYLRFSRGSLVKKSRIKMHCLLTIMEGRCHDRGSGKFSKNWRTMPASKKKLPHIRYGIHSQHICWKMVRIYVLSRRCWDMLTYQQRKSTPMLQKPV